MLNKERKGILTAMVTPVHIGHAVSVWDIRIIDEKGNMICTSRCTLAIELRPQTAIQRIT